MPTSADKDSALNLCRTWISTKADVGVEFVSATGGVRFTFMGGTVVKADSELVIRENGMTITIDLTNKSFECDLNGPKGETLYVKTLGSNDSLLVFRV